MFENGCYLRRQKRFKCKFCFIEENKKTCYLSCLGNKRENSSRLNHECDSNNNNRHHGINTNLDKSTTSTGSGQRSPLSSTSDKSCDEQILLMQQQQPQQQRSMYMSHPQQQQQQGLESSNSIIGKSLKQEQCELSQISFDPHTFPNYSTFAINSLMLPQGFAENPTALNAYYASQLPQTGFVPSSSTDYYHHHHHSSMYASPSTAI